MVRILVTGGSGNIVSHLARFLVNQDHQVTVGDSLLSGSLKNIRDIIHKNNLRFINADLTDPECCLQLTKGQDWVSHLAANVGGIAYIERVGAVIMRDNLMMNINMLEASVRNHVKRFFYSSSACVYPNYLQISPDVKALKESDDMPADPNEAYGWEKLTTEKLCQYYLRDYGLNVRIARLHNVFGGSYTSFHPEKAKAPGHLILKALQYREGEKFIVWGDGKTTRSFLYVEDCVGGIISLMQSQYNNPVTIGSDRLVTIDELVNIISEVSGKKFDIEYELSRPQGVRGRNADLTFAMEELGWRPQITLEEGIKRMYDWAESYLSEIQLEIPIPISGEHK